MKRAFLGLLMAAAITNPSQMSFTQNGTGATKRTMASKLSDVVSVKDFGAVCDGSTNDTTAIANAVATGMEVHIPQGAAGSKACISHSTIAMNVTGATLYLEPGAVLYSDANPAISVTASGVAIVGGSGAYAQITVASATNDGISATSGGNALTIRDLTIAAGNGTTRTAGAAVKLASVTGVKMRNVTIVNPWDGITLSAVGNSAFDNISITDNYAAQSIHDGVYLTSGSNLNVFRNVGVVSTTDVQGFEAGFVFGKDSDTNSCYFCQVYTPSGGASYGMWWKNEAGFAHPPQWTKVYNATMEVNHTTGVAYQFDHGRSNSLIDCYSAWGLNNVVIGANATATRIIGGEYILAYNDGILINSGTDVLIDGAMVSDASQQTNNTYSGITVANNMTGGFKIINSTSGNVLGLTPGNLQANGISVGTGSDDYTIAFNDVRANQSTTGLNDGGTGTNKQVIANRLKGGTYVTAGPMTIDNTTVSHTAGTATLTVNAASASQQASVQWADQGGLTYTLTKNTSNTWFAWDQANSHTIFQYTPAATNGNLSFSGSTVTFTSVLQANLGTPANGTIVYCSDCTTASACTGGGTGALASRQNGAWKCL